MIGYLEVLGAVLIWAIINGLVIKGVKKTSGVGVGTWMSLVGVVIFSIMFLFKNPFTELTHYQMTMLALLGLVSALNNSLFYTALKMTYVYNAALLHYFASILAIILIAFVPMFQEKLTPVDIAAVLIGFAGLAVITLPSWQGNSSKKWIYFALGSACFYSLEMVFGRIVSTHGVAPNISAFVKLLAQAGIMPIVALTLGQSIKIGEKKEKWMIVIAGVLLFLSFILYFCGVQIVPVKHSAVLGYIDRIGAILLGAYFFKERLTKNIWIGGTLILGASSLVLFFK